MPEYTLVRYRDRPEQVVTLASTPHAAEAVAFVRAWSGATPHDGVLVLVGQRELVHCPPRHVAP